MWQQDTLRKNTWKEFWGRSEYKHQEETLESNMAKKPNGRALERFSDMKCTKERD